jgi:hypothetical protein
MSEQRQEQKDWKNEIAQFQNNFNKLNRDGIENRDGSFDVFLNGGGLSTNFGTYLKHLSDELQKLENENIKSQENSSLSEEERKKVVVRSATLEANRVFFQSLNKIAEMPATDDDEKWDKRKAVLDACREYMYAQFECDGLSDSNLYITRMATASGRRVLGSIISGVILSACIYAIFEVSFLSTLQTVGLIAGPFILLQLTTEICSLIYEKIRLDAKMQTALEDPTSISTLHDQHDNQLSQNEDEQNPKNNSFWDSINKALGIDESIESWKKGMESLKRIMVNAQKTSVFSLAQAAKKEHGEEDYYKGYTNKPVKCFGNDIVEDLQTASQHSTLEIVADLLLPRAFRQGIGNQISSSFSFWSSEEKQQNQSDSNEIAATELNLSQKNK